MVALWVPNAASESLEKKSLFPFVSVILAPNIQNEPPMVALWVPNAASESLEKKSLFPFVSVILAPDTWSRHSFSQSNSDPKRASHGRTLGAKRCL